MNLIKKNVMNGEKNSFKFFSQKTHLQKKCKKRWSYIQKIDLICRHNVVGGNVVDLNKLCLKWLKDNHPNVKISKLKSPQKVPLTVRSPKRKKISCTSRFISPTF